MVLQPPPIFGARTRPVASDVQRHSGSPVELTAVPLTRCLASATIQVAFKSAEKGVYRELLHQYTSKTSMSKIASILASHIPKKCLISACVFADLSLPSRASTSAWHVERYGDAAVHMDLWIFAAGICLCAQRSAALWRCECHHHCSPSLRSLPLLLVHKSKLEHFNSRASGSKET